MIGSHLTTMDVAASPGRERVYGLIAERPGASLTDIVRATGRGVGTIQYHLYMLRRQGLVRAYKVGRSVRYVATGTTDAHGERRLAALADPRLKAILDLVEARPGCPVGEATALFATTRQAGTEHVRSLVALGLVRLERDGRFTRLRAALSPHPGRAISPQAPASDRDGTCTPETRGAAIFLAESWRRRGPSLHQ